MSVSYVTRKKVDKSGDEIKELYYAVPMCIQRTGVDEKKLAGDLSGQSSLTDGDVLSVLTQLPSKIVKYLKEGRTITIHGLGTFYLSISSEGVESPEECKPNKIKNCRICFRADKQMKDELSDCHFHRIDETGKKL